MGFGGGTGSGSNTQKTEMSRNRRILYEPRVLRFPDSEPYQI